MPVTRAIAPPNLVLRGLATLILGVLAWGCLGYLATLPLGMVFGWTGHPAIPGAPTAVYVGLYLVLLPVVCLVGAWRAVGALSRAAGRRREAD
jgi:hypothetical protein